jgi:hypothetical protein
MPRFEMPRCNKYEECETCINKEYDPFQCETCEDGSNYESDDDAESLTITEFAEMMRKAA